MTHESLVVATTETVKKSPHTEFDDLKELLVISLCDNDIMVVF